MTEIQFGSGPSSSATHRLTQTSSTLNRRYVGRPSNLAIDEAARHSSSHGSASNSTPSRLVNLRVHAADLERVQAAASAPEPEETTSEPVMPHVIEMGGGLNIDTAETTDNVTNFASLVPAEAAPVEEISYVPAVTRTSESYAANYYDNNVTNNAYPVTTSETNYQASSSALVPAQSSSPIASSEEDTQALAMNIAADYAAANLGASMATAEVAKNDLSAAITSSSVDTIAQAASEAIAAIRTASDPEEIAEQVSSLQTFADNIKASSNAPEMLELSDTIEKFVSVAMKSSRVQEEMEKQAARKQAESDAKARAKATVKVAAPKPSVARPTVKPVKPATAKRTAAPTMGARKVARPTRAAAPKATKTLLRHTPKKSVTPKIGADEEQALRKALSSVVATDTEPAAKTSRRRSVRKGNSKRFALAFFCAIVCVGAIIYFVGSSIPDISVKVAAMQTGIEASYPSYVPRDFSLDGINSEDGKITLTFKGPEKASFVLSEEKSSWDSNTLLRNYVEPTWNDSYITTHEQGITIYISGANAAWVNGGVLYKIESVNNSLTKKQLRNIVTSL